MERKTWFRFTMICLSMGIISACTTYERQVVPFKMPAAIPNATEVAGATIAALSFDDKEQAKNAFGFDIRGAGILPVQVIFDNRGSQSLEIVPSQTFLYDEANNTWPILDQKMAYDRIAKKTELGEVLPEGGKYGALAGAAGGIIGAAIGIVSGHNVGDAALKGAAIGAAGGLVGGGAQGMTEGQDTVRGQIGEDLKNRSLERRAVKPNEIAHGFIFFPGEIKKAKMLQLQIKVTGTGAIHTLKFAL
jgi:hypothetical protein